METKYKVVYTGRLREGFRHDDVVANLTSQTNLDEKRAQKLLAATKPVLIKKDVDLQTAEKYRSRFHHAGLEIKLIKTRPLEAASGAEQTAAGGKTAPAAEARQPVPPAVPEVPPENPYAAPSADLKVNRQQVGSWLEQPQRVPASHGWHWIRSAIDMFLAQPWKWVAISLFVLVVVGILNIIPIVGSFIAYLLGSVLAGGVMLTAQSQANGEGIRFSSLFDGFHHNRNQLLLVAVYYIAFFVVFGIAAVIIFYLSFGKSPWNAEAFPMVLQNHLPLFFLIILIGMAISIPLMMAIWFAVPLVALADRSAWTAYKHSFRGCLINWLAFLVYGLAFMVLGFLTMIAFSALSGLMAFFLARSHQFILVILPMVLMMLVWFPMVVIGWLSMYTGFKDIYYKSV